MYNKFITNSIVDKQINATLINKKAVWDKTNVNKTNKQLIVIQNNSTTKNTEKMLNLLKTSINIKANKKIFNIKT